MSENSNLASSHQLVLMDQSAQPVAPTYWSWIAPEMPVPTARSAYHLQGHSSFRRRNLLRQALVRAVPVVVTGVAAQDAFEVGFVHDQQVVQALRSHGAHEPFGEGVRIRGPIGRLEDLGTFSFEYFVEARHGLGVPVADQEPGGDLCVGEIAGDVPGLLVDPSFIGMCGHPGDPDPPAAEFDEEQHVETIEQHGVDVEEVRGHDARRLGTEELTPGGAVSPGSRAEVVVVVVVLHDVGDGALGQAHTELAQLTLDAPVASPRVLPGQAHHERSHLVVDARATRRAMSVRPASGHQSAVPGQQGGRSHTEGHPGRTGEQATEDGQQGTIGGLVGTTPDLAPKHLLFMGQGEELDLLGGLAAKEQQNQLE